MGTMKPDAFGVWDTELQRWFRRPNKFAWGSKNAAANAWNVGRYGKPKFSEQTRYVVKPIKFFAIDGPAS